MMREQIIVVVALCLLGCGPGRRGQQTTGDTVPVFTSDDARSIYAGDPNDSWNRIFSYLFTRKITVKLSDQFSEGAPFVRPAPDALMAAPGLRVSTRTFERVESGDRAIEPLYPSFLSSDGARYLAQEPQFSALKQALQEALTERSARPAIARALMQADVWAAYDILYRAQAAHSDRDFPGRKTELLSLFAKLVKKLALTRNEIQNLPANYSLAAARLGLPDLFSSETGWIEIELLPDRLHDSSSDYRRAARVFVKPRTMNVSAPQLVESLKDNQGVVQKLDAVALVVQDLLIDDTGAIVPSPIFRDFQIRRFHIDPAGQLVKPEVEQCELSRRSFLTDPRSGGFVRHDENAPDYLSSAGNDYGFATPLLDERRVPLQVHLRTRCSQCHGENATTLMTFSVHDFGGLPPVKILDARKDERAVYVAAHKQSREDLRSLLASQ